MADNDQICKDFNDNVNMTASELKKWLATDEAKSVGIKQGTASDKKSSPGGAESTGHASGEQIITILGKKKADLTDDDYTQMKRVSAYVKRHLAQKPTKEDIKTSRWRYSLMNWGNDPLK